ncbi:hypothetical protein F0L68_05895 [Solihabitans fulvus]|uniref:Uncharacterized protein n=1 Tax=Solihabitans fulvus TaxID=1892852 RepID=A0A5B2XP34_9PSEU|nr:hypothetical protein [Solihabitans fulvus]KAA2264629.1 hypothetical protein F0L68_05895 [Solihabitans fulvus]
MTAPPPPGWGQQPQGQPPYGYPQQQGQQQQGQPQPGQPPQYGQPKRRSRTGLIVTLAIVVVVLLGAGGYFFYLYSAYSKAQGSAASGQQPPPECKISEQTQAQAHTTNFFLKAKSKPDDLVPSTTCSWEQTEGKDGTDRRVLAILVTDYRGFKEDAEKQAGKAYSGFADHPVSGETVKKVPGLGDEASYSLPPVPGSQEVDLVIRKGSIVYKFEYIGENRGFFGNTPFPVDEGERITKLAAQDVLGQR